MTAIVQAIQQVQPKIIPGFIHWREALQTLLAGQELETLAGEARLETLSMELRQIWLRFAHGFGDAHLKSPPTGRVIRLPTGERARFSYERCVSPNHLERRCQGYRAARPDWEATHLVFQSGMAAIVLLLHACVRTYKPTVQTPLRLDLFGGYYETTRALRLFSEPLFSSRRITSQGELARRIEARENNILLLEPVPYDWEMEPLEVAPLLRALRARVTSPMLMVIVDSTIVGPAFQMGAFLEGLDMADPPLVIQLNSGLKLDQEGLELAHVGIVTLYAPKRSATGLSLGERLVKAMRADRKIFGNALSMDEMAILDLPFFLDPVAHLRYCQGVFHNNRLLAESIQPGGLFSRIVHPALASGAEQGWAVAPFVVFHFRPELDTESNH
ncbi:MAG: hypothetical protein HQM02_13535, partial [Magnetococcales bacterium]|nr:hypothetical protein [Magnetococcales bacterium]